MADLIKFRRGLKESLSTLNLGEPGFVKDEERLYLGGLYGNVPIPNKTDIEQIYLNNTLPDKVELHEMFKYFVGDSGYPVIESFCFTDDSIIIGTIQSGNTGTKIYKFNKTTFALIAISTTHNYGHCNDMCYNPDTGYVYICYSDNSDKIGVMNPADLSFVEDIQCTAGTGYYGIDYDSANNQYVLRGVLGGPNITVADTNFNVLETYTPLADTYINDTYVTQGLGIKTGRKLIIETYSKPECLVVYDFNGDKLKTIPLNIPSQTFEIETIKYVASEDKWYAVIAENNGDASLCHVHIYEIDLRNNEKMFPAEYLKNRYIYQTLNLYVDNTFTGISDGSSSKPYKSLAELSIMLKNFNDFVGNIYVHLMNASYDENLVLRDIIPQLYIRGVDAYSSIKSILMKDCASSHIGLDYMTMSAAASADLNSDSSFVSVTNTTFITLANFKIPNSAAISGAIGIYSQNSKIQIDTSVEVDNCSKVIDGHGFSQVDITAGMTGTGNTNSFVMANGSIIGSKTNAIDGIMNIGMNAMVDTRQNLASGTNLNSLIYKGKYMVLGTGLGGTLLNYPISSNGIIDVDYIQGTQYIIQKVIGYTVGDIYYRFSTDSGTTWTAWQKINVTAV